MTVLLSKEHLLERSSATIHLTAAQAMLRYLAAQQSEMLDGTIEPLFGGMFGIFGHGNVAGMGEALANSTASLPFFRGQNEQGMAHAAIAFAKANRCRRVMGVTTSIGPGASNLLTAATLAHINRLPVLFVPGDVFVSRRPDPVLQQLEDEASPLLTANSCFQPVSRYFDCITRPEQILTSLPRAIRTMMDPVRRGPATLAFPQDVQTEAYDYPLDFFEPCVHKVFRPEPDSRQLK
ncbi:MAG: 3D-(3,5/4)-trihydroxycyclohexane-1,2-dione acylhydrolase (decyclizing), partial [Chlamydiales bacterium]